MTGGHGPAGNIILLITEGAIKTPEARPREEVTPSGLGIMNKKKIHLGSEGLGTASSWTGLLRSLTPFCSYVPET